MIARANLQTKTAATPKPSFTPVHASLLQRKCACGESPEMAGECTERKRKKLTMQRASLSPCGRGSLNLPSPLRGEGKGEGESVPSIVHDVLRSSGQPLDRAARAFMEPRFGHDFSQVRVHNGAKAAESARAVNAMAYTVGRDVVFGPGQYATGTQAGRRLLAHELTHVVQQREPGGTPQAKLMINMPGDASEQEADRVAAKVVRGEPFVPPLNHVAAVARRQPDAGASPSADAGTASAPATCALNNPKDCTTYEDWLNTFPAASVSADKIITSSMPADLAGLISGTLSTGGGLPDCADVAMVLRHYYLKARGQSFAFMVGRDKKTAVTYTLGKATSDKEIRACMIGAGTESFQETRSGFALVNFYNEKGKNILNLKTLLAKGLKPSDMFVWKRLPTIKGNFQGHAQTVQTVSPPKLDPKDPKKVTQDGSIAVVQGNMSSGKGTGSLEQRVYSFTDLTGTQDGDADIGEEPRHHEESFFGSGPWKT